MVRLRQPKPRPSELRTKRLEVRTPSLRSNPLNSYLLSLSSYLLSPSSNPLSSYLLSFSSYPLSLSSKTLRSYPLVLCSYLLPLLLLASCQPKAGTGQFDPLRVAFTATTSPLLDGQLYPSLILATNGTNNSEPRTPNPELTSPFTCTLTSPRDNAVLRILIDSSALNYVTIIQEILPHRGETYTFAPSVKWKYDALKKLRQPLPLDLTITCYINDEQVDIKNLRLNARPVNECPLSLRTADTIVDTRWLFAAYVNEDHPYIQQILTDILDQNPTLRLTGYQNGTRNVTEQVLAVWRYALQRGLTYASISCTSNPSPNANVQHIRFFDEIYQNRQANCVDACVFFASILRKIGLKPVIFVEPCHAYLGYYTDKKRNDIALLETTVTSWVNLPDLRRSLLPDGTLPQPQLAKIAKYLSEKQLQDWNNGQLTFDQLTDAVARSLFEKASSYNRETHNANRHLFADPANISCQQLDIELLRQKVQPVK